MRAIQSIYINSFPVYSSIKEIAVIFMAPPKGVPAPPSWEPQAMAHKIGTAGSQFLISLYPAAANMDTAMGVKMATTTTFGIILDKTAADKSHTAICDFMEGPIKDKAFKEIRLSKPIFAQGAVNKQEPKINTMLEEAY